MISRKAFWSGALAIAVAGLAMGAVLADQVLHHEVNTVDAAWKEVFEAPSQMVRSVDTVALAKVVSVQPGRVAYSENGEDALPFQVVEFEVVNGLKGARRQQRIFVERAGGITPGGQAVNIEIDGGAFENGATYLLFLKKQEEGPFFYQVNHQGRYLLDKGLLWAVTEDDPVAQFFDGQSLTQGLSLVKDHLRAQVQTVNP
jgi:hypothetical protein